MHDLMPRQDARFRKVSVRSTSVEDIVERLDKAPLNAFRYNTRAPVYQREPGDCGGSVPLGT